MVADPDGRSVALLEEDAVKVGLSWSFMWEEGAESGRHGGEGRDER